MIITIGKRILAIILAITMVMSQFSATVLVVNAATNEMSVDALEEKSLHEDEVTVLYNDLSDSDLAQTEIDEDVELQEDTADDQGLQEDTADDQGLQEDTADVEDISEMETDAVDEYYSELQKVASCRVIAEGRFENQGAAAGGMQGSPWHVCDNGVLEVNEGFVHNTTRSPWLGQNTNIREIVFTGPITGGTRLSYLFSGLTNVTTIKGLEHFDTSSVTNMSFMFNDASSLTSLDLSNFNTSNVTNMNGMFSGALRLTSLDLSNFNTSNVTNMSSMFSQTWSLTSLDVSNFDTSRVRDMSAMFYRASALTSLDVSNFDTSRVRSMERMFNDVSSLTSLDVSNFDTSRVRSMSSMFAEASSLTSLDVSNFDTSRVTNVSSMFRRARSLTSLDVSNFDTSNVTNMGRMFGDASSLTSLDVSNFDTSRVTNMGIMFNGSSSLTNLDLSNFNTSRVTNMEGMFSDASSLTSLDMSNFDTSRVTNMEGMFSDASSLTSLDMSNFDTSRVRSMSYMFNGASSLTSLDLSNFNTSNVTNITAMLARTTNLRQLTLGENFRMNNTVGLPAIRSTEEFTGFWQNVGNGTVDRPNGNFILTSSQFMTQFNPATMADTWVWQRSSVDYTITFHANGGENAPATQIKIEDQALTLTEEIPTRFGYSFLGWSISSDATEAEYQPGSIFVRNEDTTLFAVWQAEQEQGRIFALNVDDYIGEIDQEAQTITFRVPQQSLIFGRLVGRITFDADDESIMLSSLGNEFPIMPNMLGMFIPGDTIATPDGVVYTIIIESNGIFDLSVNYFQGEINQTEQTIAFHVPAHSLLFGNLLIGQITDLQASSEYVIVSFNGNNQAFKQGDQVMLSSGETISTPDGVVYTVQIIPS